ncbi:methyl-accepting chemotaxis protein [Alkalinema pantanalense CENA528]|uniref:methyl-accepting chemotaxis protein n=1 Tax=Alkalinema pantanalense TaxID=1620705 RepID=UPI003D6FB79F
MVDQLNTTTTSRMSPTSRAEIADTTLSSSVIPPSPPASLPKLQTRSPKRHWDELIQRTQQMSLRTKATALAIVVGTLPIVGIGGLAYSVADRTLSQQITQAGIAQSKGLADKLNRFMNERLGDILVLSRQPALVNERIRKTLDRQDKDDLLSRFVEAYGVYESVAVFDLNGDVVAQSAGDKLANHRDRTYFQQAIATRTPIITSPEKSITTGRWVIHIAAPLIDDNSRKLIGVVRTRIPIEKLDDIARPFAVNGAHYHVIDGSGNIFLASDAQREQNFGQSALQEFPAIAQFLNQRREGAAVGKHDDEEQFIGYAPVQRLEGLDLRWGAIINLSSNIAFAPQRSLLTTIALGTALTALGVGLLAAWLARRGTQPLLEASQAVQALGDGKLDTRLQVKGQDELAILGDNINQMAAQLEQLIIQQTRSAEQSNLLSKVVVNIRRSLQFDDILKTGVEEIREFLKCDRVVIYRFNSDWISGVITAESVSSGWPIALGQTIEDPLTPGTLDRYRSGRVWTIDDWNQQTLTDCHCKILEKLAVKANMVAPIMRAGELIGLLCAHQCEAPRHWETEEIDFFKQLSTQIGFALDQALLLEQTEQARQTAETLSEERRQQKDNLQMQLLELLSNVEGAAMGNLTVRADVNAGDIGTVADFFNSIIESLRTIVLQVKDSATQVNQSLAANEMAIVQLAEESGRQAEETDRTLGSLATMAQSIRAVADNAQQAAAITRSAAENAQTGGAAMESTVNNILTLRTTIGDTAKKVKRLGESSQEISKVISLINQIAMQTNLLAINAGIEAARAGEDGQGFAVVAEEVAELATRAAAATREIETIVLTIQQETAEVVNAMEQGTSQVVKSTRLVNDAKDTLGQVVEVARQVDELVQAISEATVSQVATSNAISDRMREIAQFSSRTSDSSRDVSATLRQTLNIAQELQASVGTFVVD